MAESTARLEVLLVEDDASIRRFVAMALEDEPVALTEASSLAQARACLAGQAYDVVIADLMLGDGNGLDLLRELAAQAGLLRVAFSAGVDRGVRARLAELGVTEILAKPVSVAALRSAVARAREQGRGGAGPAASVAPAATTSAELTPQQAAAIERCFGGDRDLFERFRQQCRVQFVHDLAQGDALADGAQLAGLRHLGHSLKSVLAMLGDDLGSDAARALERAAAQGDAAQALRHWQALAAVLRGL